MRAEVRSMNSRRDDLPSHCDTGTSCAFTIHMHLVSAANPEAAGCVERFATFMSLLLVIITFPFSLFECFKVVQEFERAVIFRLGRLRKGGARGPGLFFVLPCIDTYRKVDLRTVSFDVPPQEVLTRDSVTVAVDAVVYYRIKEPLNAVVRVADYSASTRLLAATTLRNVLGMRDLAQLLSDREAISHMMQANLDEATDPWGVEVERVEIKDVRLPVQLQRAMAAEAEADREARAKIIAAEGEIKASRALKEASLVMVDNPMALQLRYLQSLNTISAEKNSTIIFPFPMDFLRSFMSPGAGTSITHSHLPV
ncbi:band 7 protein AGAP004871-like isoform X1 [Pieris napi]|uniref:band 7 protein AGAP004871-like isoform X1 n=1 Tax=Pieris napi TaxID=78633 RepID=UPI001FBB711D|nr:band 7 protein AGAP004871-like isoform X1 [Pieris napi]